MMNAKIAANYLIVYFSVAGSTKKIATMIKEELSKDSGECKLLSLSDDINKVNFEEFDHIFIGTPTYGEGKTPKQMLNFLRFLLKDNDFSLPNVSVFGSGETQFGEDMYCRAVDELEYHFSKKTDVIAKVKIEQYPVSKKQKDLIKSFVNKSIGGK